MDVIANEMDALRMDVFCAKRQPLHLLNLPPEIRIRLYSYLFDVNVPIPITVNSRNYLESKPDIKSGRIQPLVPCLSSQILRTCHQIFEEGTVYLYGVNTFAIVDTDTWKFAPLKLSLGTRLCINKLLITVSLGHHPDYNSISSQFPAVPALEVSVKGPGPALLLVIYELSKVLVCSDILPNEPSLEICATVPCTAAALNRNEATLSRTEYYEVANLPSKSNRFRNVMQSRRDLTLVKLDPFAKPLLGLGKQMDELTLIRVHGELHPDYIKAIEGHECSFGDCSFEKRSEDPVDDKGFKAIVYAWKKKGGEAAAIRGKDMSDAATLMREFVPKLSQNFVEAMKQAGLDTHFLEEMSSW